MILNRQANLDERCSYRVTTVILVFDLCLLGFSFLMWNAFSQWPMVANYCLSGPCLMQDFCVLLLSSEVPQLFDLWIDYCLLCWLVDWMAVVLPSTVSFYKSVSI